jgi:hypothetical protein
MSAIVSPDAAYFFARRGAPPLECAQSTKKRLLEELTRSHGGSKLPHSEGAFGAKDKNYPAGMPP